MITTAQHNASWVDWLCTFDFNYFATYTFAPKANRVVGPYGGIKMFKRYLGQFPCAILYYAIAEDHKWRDDAHLHCLMKVKDIPQIQLQAGWRHGRSQVGRLAKGGISYCIKEFSRMSSIVSEDNLWKAQGWPN